MFFKFTGFKGLREGRRVRWTDSNMGGGLWNPIWWRAVGRDKWFIAVPEQTTPNKYKCVSININDGMREEEEDEWMTDVGKSSK